MFIDRNDILNLYVVTNLQLPDGPPSGPVPRDIGTSTAANVGDTVIDNAYGIGVARVMNDGNGFRRFGRSPHIDSGLGTPNAVTPTTPYPATPTPSESAASFCGAPASACPLAQRNCTAPDKDNCSQSRPRRGYITSD
jgi:hypothetical protein